MAREAVCSSTHQPNGMRPLQANQARSILIGCELHRVNHPGAGAVPRRKEGRRRRRGEERGPHLSACHSHKIFSGLNGARATNSRIEAFRIEYLSIKHIFRLHGFLFFREGVEETLAFQNITLYK